MHEKRYAISEHVEDPSLDDLLYRAKHDPMPLSPEHIAELDRQDSISVDTLTEVVGVIAGIKPTALLYMVDIPNFDALHDLLTRMGLVVVSDTDFIVVSRYEQLSSRLFTLVTEGVSWSHGDAEELAVQEHAVGQLLGYPSTAVEYYLQRIQKFHATAEWDDLLDVRDSTGKRIKSSLLHFMVSPKHARDEIDNYVAPLEEAVKSLTPRTYQRL